MQFREIWNRFWWWQKLVSFEVITRTKFLSHPTQTRNALRKLFLTISSSNWKNYRSWNGSLPTELSNSEGHFGSNVDFNGCDWSLSLLQIWFTNVWLKIPWFIITLTSSYGAIDSRQRTGSEWPYLLEYTRTQTWL